MEADQSRQPGIESSGEWVSSQCGIELLAMTTIIFFVIGCVLVGYAGLVENEALRYGQNVPTRAHVAGGVGMGLALAALVFWYVPS